MPRKKVGIIGGGASGLIAAITAAKDGAEVTILEHKDRVGKKILMTGNGKCNLTNLHIEQDVYYSHELAYAMEILEQFGPKDTIAFMEELGLWTKEKRDGGIYPVSEQAAVVLDTLMESCRLENIKTILQCHIQEIMPGNVVGVKGYVEIPEEVKIPENTKPGKKPKKPEVVYHRKPYREQFDTLILACGSKACAVTGSDGSGYEYAKTLGLRLYETSPALVQLHGTCEHLKALAGVRVEGAVSLEIDGVMQAREYGEIQMTDYGISGIPVFQISRLATQAFLQKRQCVAEIDLFPYHQNPLPWSRFPQKGAESFLEGYVNKKIAGVLLKQASCKLDQKVNTLSDKAREQIEKNMHHFRIPLTKSNPFENAQVCAGGVDLREVEKDLSCKKYPNIYIVGELLDVDGKCGGYNLQWAWTTGYLAGKSAAKNAAGKYGE